jgi:branched-chain amino acid transport system substrate-binding protein
VVVSVTNLVLSAFTRKPRGPGSGPGSGPGGTVGTRPAKAKSTDPVKVAAAMEGIKVDSFNGEVEMRKADHQLQQPLYMTVWQKADKKYPYSPENTGMTLAPLKEYPNYVSSTPTSCQMKRPS